MICWSDLHIYLFISYPNYCDMKVLLGYITFLTSEGSCMVLLVPEWHSLAVGKTTLASV